MRWMCGNLQLKKIPLAAIDLAILYVKVFFRNFHKSLLAILTYLAVVTNASPQDEDTRAGSACGSWMLYLRKPR